MKVEFDFGGIISTVVIVIIFSWLAIFSASWITANVQSILIYLQATWILFLSISSIRLPIILGLFTFLVLIEYQYRPIRKLFNYVQLRVYFYRTAQWRRQRFGEFREDIKSGSVNNFEVQAKRVVK